MDPNPEDRPNPAERAPPVDRPNLPERFGRYELLRKLGAGGMAEVYLARAPAAHGLEKLLVIKQIQPAFANREHFVNQFIDEAKIALTLNHPNIVQVFDFGQVGQTYFLAMEYVDGLDLMQLGRAAALQEKRVGYGISALIGKQAAAGLYYAHRKADEYGTPLEIVHRDMSPQNVLVSLDGTVKVLDFGIAHARGSRTKDTGTVKGKYAYMSPEQASAKKLDARSDIFSLGIVLWELTTGQPLFRKLKAKEALDAIRRASIPSPRSVCSDYPEALEAILMKCLAAHPNDRYRSARELQRELAQFVHRQDQIYDADSLGQLIRELTGRRERVSAPHAPAETPLANMASGAFKRPPAMAPTKERKNVVVLNCAIDGLAKPALSQQLLGFVKLAENIVYKHRGLIARIDSDSVESVFGVPIGSEDDAAGAVRAALALIDAAHGIETDEGVKPTLSAGIQRGSAIVFSHGDGELSYQVDSFTLDVAAKLATNANPGQILCGGGAYRFARRDFRFEALAEPMRHESGPDLRVYGVKGARSRGDRMRHGQRDLLFGRDLELRRLQESLQQAVDASTPRSVAIIGQPGIGKRAVANALVTRLDPKELHIGQTIARPSQREQPFALLADLVRDLLDIGDEASSDETKQAVLKALDSMPKDTRGLTAAALVGLLGGRARPSRDEAARGRELTAALGALLGQLENKPLLLYISDLHNADRASIETLTAAFQQLDQPALLLVTTRPTHEAETHLSGFDTVQLQDLTPAQAHDLILARLRHSDTEAHNLARQIYAHTGGNPLFIHEMVESLIERGVLQELQEGDGSHLTWVEKDAPLRVPTTVEGVIASRIDGLAAPQKATLLQAAVIGANFTLRELHQIDQSIEQTRLAELVERGLVEPTNSGFRFVNQLTWQVAYHSTPPTDRANLHRRIADRLSSATDYVEGAHDGTIARNLELAGERELALPAFLRAARHARHSNDDAEALRLYGRALKLTLPRDYNLCFDIREQRERIFDRWGQRAKQKRELEAMVTLSKKAAGPTRRRYIAALREAQFALQLGKLEQAAELAEQTAKKAADSDLIAEAWRIKACADQGRGDYAAARAAVANGIDACAKDNRGKLRRAALMETEGISLQHTGELRAALKAYAQSLLIYHRLQRVGRAAALLDRMGSAAFALGRIDDALGYLRRALALSQRSSDRIGLAKRLINIGSVYARYGELKLATRYLEQALRINLALGDNSSAAKAMITVGQIRARSTETESAKSLFEHAASLARSAPDLYQYVRAACALGEVLVDEGAATEALGWLDEAAQIAENASLPTGRAHALALAATAWLQLSNPDRALALAEQAEQLAAQEAHIEKPEDVKRLCADVYSACGQTERALAIREALRASFNAQAAQIRNAKWRDRFLRRRTIESLMAEDKSDKQRT